MDTPRHFTDMYDDPNVPHPEHRVLSGVAWFELVLVALLLVGAFVGFWYVLLRAVLRS